MLSDRAGTRASLLFVSHFLNFAGYYFFLVILTNMGLIAFSRGMTVPVRLLTLVCLGGIVLLNGRFYLTAAIRPVLVFSCLYIARILIEMVEVSKFHIEPSEFLLYFLAFSALPVIIISGLKLTQRDYNAIRSAILVSSLLLAVATLFFYRQLIGTVGRISLAIASDENYISPLALSYCGTLALGVGITYWMENKLQGWNKLMVSAAVLSSLVPFYLGSSRGSIFALLLPFVIMFMCKKGSASSIRILVILLVTVVGGVYLGHMFGSNIIERFTDIGSDISEGNDEAIRLQMWRSGLEQFFDNPIFGNSLEADKFMMYPHNIIIEVLLSTGIVGLIPFSIIIINGFKRVIFIYKNDPRNAWIAVIFIQSFIQCMFSGAIYTSSWIWCSLGLLYAYGFSAQQQNVGVHSPAPPGAARVLLINPN
jgi:O-antigen ligase